MGSDDGVGRLIVGSVIAGRVGRVIAGRLGIESMVGRLGSVRAGRLGASALRVGRRVGSVSSAIMNVDVVRNWYGMK